jgi:uncharacterized protein with NAD-binding domain and iron-sulfur cluster
MQKIAVLGGGIGSLSAVLEITSDPNWKQKYDITVYQLGWRLGGKGASGRNRNMHDRIEEHGIHLWMGFYENAFRVIRKVYEEANQKKLMPTSPFTDATKAFSPMRYTPMMEEYHGKWQVWSIDWPGSGEFPGDKDLFDNKKLPPSIWEFIQMIMGHVTEQLDQNRDKHPVLVELYDFGLAGLRESLGDHPALPGHAVPPKPHTLVHRVLAYTGLMHVDVKAHKSDDHKSILGWIRAFLDKLLSLVVHAMEEDTDLRHLVIMVETALSVVIGIISDDLMNRGFLAIDDEDFIEWLARHGCRHARSPLTTGMYDACFAYQGGEKSKMKMAAGTTLYGSLRLMFTYRGALMWWMNAGMGETVFSPIYLVLRDRGVKFEFFHRIKNLGLSADKKTVDRIDIDVQATVKAGPYEPLFIGSDGIPVWPTEPDWSQLQESDAIRACQNPNLESWWTDWPGVAPKTLRQGQDFDQVIYGISLGAHQYLCQELIAADVRWQNMVANLETVRTQGLQLWMNKNLADAGWPNARGIACGWVEPFDTWSDMSHLIPRETWPPSSNVRQIAYFCNVIPDDKTAPFTDPSYPAAELQKVREYARGFLDKNCGLIWPNVREPGDHKKFDDATLVNCALDPAIGNFQTQFFRVNIDPTELYCLSLPGTTKFRLPPWKSGFANLYLAGDWTLTDLNLGCIEATVISGMMASKAICGKPDHIYAAFGTEIPIDSGGTA